MSYNLSRILYNLQETIFFNGDGIIRGGGDVRGAPILQRFSSFFDGTSGKVLKQNDVKYQTVFLITPELETSTTFS